MRFFNILLFFVSVCFIIGLTGCQSTNDDGGTGTIVPKATGEPGSGPSANLADFENQLAGLDALGDDITLGEWGKSDGTVPDRMGGGEWAPIPGLKFPVIKFAYDQDLIGASERPKLEVVAEYMQKHKQIGVIIEGHCDERGSVEYNRALGERRALAVKNYLVSLGVSENRFKTVSFGEERPAVEGNTAQAHAENRRAELVPAKM